MPVKLYDWDGWFAQGKFALNRGIDYVCSQTAMASQIRNAASRRRLTIRITDEGDSLIVRVIRDSQPVTVQPDF